MSADIRWYHTFDFPELQTKGIDNTPRHWDFVFPKGIHVKDRTVLDIGSWDGYYAFKMERLGAKQVIATDRYCWGGDGWGTKAGFNRAKHVLRSKVESLEIEADRISPSTVGTYDLVLLLGVLYHRVDFYTVLANACAVTQERLVVETAVDLQVPQDMPLVRFYPDASLLNDPTNWFVPNQAAVLAMLGSLEFNVVEKHLLDDPQLGQRLAVHAVPRPTRTQRFKTWQGRT